jgi:hypothetical protein
MAGGRKSGEQEAGADGRKRTLSPDGENEIADAR